MKKLYNLEIDMKIATWSGPRNISTALMRSWSSRKDTIVIDEPFYASYLHRTQLKHPFYDEIINKYPVNDQEIIKILTGSIPDNKNIWYQKHMAHHICNFDSLSWILKLQNCFIIRKPNHVINSYIKKNELKKTEELGYIQQFKLINFLIKNSADFIVIDTESLLKNPEKILTLWCKHFGLNFNKSMLKWKKGYHPNDGIWAKHWYSNVIKSSSFGRLKNNNTDVNDFYLEIYEECMFYYNQMKKFELLG